MGIVLLYQKDDKELQLALKEFFTNSEACSTAMITSEHLEQIYLAYIFVEDDIVVGLCALFKNKYVSSELILVVREGFQEQGIAKTLQKELLSKARSKDLPVTLTTYDTDTYKHVIRFYEQFGFVRLRKYRRQVLYGLTTNKNLFTIKRILIFYFLAIRKDLIAFVRRFQN